MQGKELRGWCRSFPTNEPRWRVIWSPVIKLPLWLAMMACRPPSHDPLLLEHAAWLAAPSTTLMSGPFYELVIPKRGVELGNLKFYSKLWLYHLVKTYVRK